MAAEKKQAKIWCNLIFAACGGGYKKEQSGGQLLKVGTGNSPVTKRVPCCYVTNRVTNSDFFFYYNIRVTNSRFLISVKIFQWVPRKFYFG